MQSLKRQDTKRRAFEESILKQLRISLEEEEGEERNFTSFKLRANPLSYYNVMQRKQQQQEVKDEPSRADSKFTPNRQRPSWLLVCCCLYWLAGVMMMLSVVVMVVGAAGAAAGQEGLDCDPIASGLKLTRRSQIGAQLEPKAITKFGKLTNKSILLTLLNKGHFEPLVLLANRLSSGALGSLNKEQSSFVC